MFSETRHVKCVHVHIDYALDKLTGGVTASVNKQKKIFVNISVIDEQDYIIVQSQIQGISFALMNNSVINKVFQIISLMI